MERFFVNLTNNDSVVVGGVRKLAEFDRSRVVIEVAGARVIINGDLLKIARFDENEMCVEGKIAGVETASRQTSRTGLGGRRNTDAKQEAAHTPLHEGQEVQRHV